MIDLLHGPAPDPLNRALEELHFAFRAVVEGPDAELAKHSLSRVHHRVLYFIARSPGIKPGELLATLNVTKQALNAPLRQLTKRGFVAEVADEKDGRVKHLQLTRSGRALEERLSGEQRRRFERVFAQVGPRKERAWREVMALLAVD